MAELTASQLKEILTAIGAQTAQQITEAVKTALNHEDPRTVAQRESLRKAKLATIARQQDTQRRTQGACAHKRKDLNEQIPSYRISWLRNSDGVWRGVCHLCNKMISPTTCTPDEYKQLFRDSLDQLTAGAAPLNLHAVAGRKAAGR